MTASFVLPGHTGRTVSPRLVGLRPLIRKDVAEWTRGKRAWIIVAVSTAFMTLTAANAVITSWLIANLPDGAIPPEPLPLDPMSNLMTAVGAQFFVLVAILAAMSLLVAEREHGTLSWVASKPVSRGAIWLSKWTTASGVVALLAGVVPLIATFALVTFLYGTAGLGAVVILGIGVVASIALMIAVVLAASAFVPNQPAVAAIGFATFALPPVIAGLSPVNIEPYLPTSILGWTAGLATGADVGIVTPLAWVISLVVLAGIAVRGMEAMEL